jgi:hypothetical protein
MVMVGSDPVEVERALLAGELVCPDCSGVLRPWGHARWRSSRGEHDGVVRHRPRRSACSGCARTHVLMVESWLVRGSRRARSASSPDPHQWRHTFACRLINRDVPQEVIRVLLDHQSTQMTAHYARITDQTVRRRWEQATKVNIKGERIDIDPDGPLGQAQWAKTRYGMATQTLPHGYCGLPVQKSCPHANACLTCPVFLTGPEFLPELREHRGRTLTLIDKAEADGHTRMVQMNTDVLANLDKMIGGIDHEPAGTADAS